MNNSACPFFSLSTAMLLARARARSAGIRKRSPVRAVRSIRTALGPPGSTKAFEEHSKKLKAMVVHNGPTIRIGSCGYEGCKREGMHVHRDLLEEAFEVLCTEYAERPEKTPQEIDLVFCAKRYLLELIAETKVVEDPERLP
jgi:hypothetical protein